MSAKYEKNRKFDERILRQEGQRKIFTACYLHLVVQRTRILHVGSDP